MRSEEPPRGTWCGRIAFVSVLIFGVVLVIHNTHDFGDHKTRTTVRVAKGPGADRHITRTEIGEPQTTGDGGTATAEERKVETTRERPEGELARQKTTVEGHEASFLENLIGDKGAVFIQLIAVVLAAFLVGAVASRVSAGSFNFKLGPIEFAGESALIESAAFTAALAEATKGLEERLDDLERASEIKAPRVGPSVPSGPTFVQSFAATLSRGLARTSAAEPRGALEQRIRVTQEEFEAPAAEERGRAPTPPTAPNPSRASSADEGTPPDEERTRPWRWQIRAMEGLLDFAPSRPAEPSDRSGLLVASLERSTGTYRAICTLLRRSSPLQAGTLVGSLYEDVIVAHLLSRPGEQNQRIVDAFLGDREAMAGRRRELAVETDFRFATDEGEAGDADAARRRRGDALTDLVARLAANDRDLADLIPEFGAFDTAKGPFLDQLHRVIVDWLDRFADTAAVGISVPSAAEEGRVRRYDPTTLVGFAAAWLYALQVYLGAELEAAAPDRVEELNIAWYRGLLDLGNVAVGPQNAANLLGQWATHYGHLSGDRD